MTGLETGGMWGISQPVGGAAVSGQTKTIEKIITSNFFFMVLRARPSRCPLTHEESSVLGAEFKRSAGLKFKSSAGLKFKRSAGLEPRRPLELELR